MPPPRLPGMLGEKSIGVPEQLLAAVVTSADHMAQSILSTSPAAAVVVQVGAGSGLGHRVLMAVAGTAMSAYC